MPTARLPLVCHSADDVNSAQASLYGGAQRQSSVSNVFAQLLNSDKNCMHWLSRLIEYYEQFVVHHIDGSNLFVTYV